ncbi:hypothetical protein MK805_02575 [Shimazuella sp. AN120528]|uniref:hypothetical protein n=1 Tax=Shimazuella soli TaxID=1892854 RepID=UPI001F0E50C4|nr:hypothetical protein [Shimazuella soli]MCH5583852.1 hypothetical protein [Shimazuella soli]
MTAQTKLPAVLDVNQKVENNGSIVTTVIYGEVTTGVTTVTVTRRDGKTYIPNINGESVWTTDDIEVNEYYDGKHVMIPSAWGNAWIPLWYFYIATREDLDDPYFW